jgi:polyphosphate glucokinase
MRAKSGKTPTGSSVTKRRPAAAGSKTSSQGNSQKAPSRIGPCTLAIDIGGTGLKATVLNARGQMLVERVRIETPENCSPRQMIALLKKLTAPLPRYDRVSVGFPGVVRKGVIMTAHNLGTKAWKGFNLDAALTKAFGKPVRVLNDADIQGLGAVRGKGVELVITLGTGMGSSFFEDGNLAPHLELAHHPFRQGQTYEEQLGNAAFEEVGRKRWNRRLRKAIDTLRRLTTFDRMYIGGGNAKEISFKLPPDISVVSNELGLRGGIWLWHERGRD